MNDIEVKAEILQFITANNGQYYEVGLQVNFTQYPAGYLRIILRQLEAEGKIFGFFGLPLFPVFGYSIFTP
jgi:hypothetical protein